MQSDEESEKQKTAVSNPNYMSLDKEQAEAEESTFLQDETIYVNSAIEQPKFNFAEDDIFNTNKHFKPCLTKEGRTYSEPDSGVGIDVALDNILYHKLQTAASNE